jgi:hypothetical protein
MTFELHIKGTETSPIRRQTCEWSRRLWSAVTCHRFPRLADLSAKQSRVPAARSTTDARAAPTATSRLRKAVTSHRTP